MAPHILIVYGTSYGQTGRIAHRIADELAERGFHVSVERGDALPSRFTLADYDGVLVGASMIIGGFQRCIRRFVRHHAAGLNAMPSGFFAISGSAGSARAGEREEARRIARAFLQRSHWTPALCASIAGAVAYTRYGVVLRAVMKRISRKEGGSTDTSRDHEYTDWSQVAQFAASFAFRVLASPRNGPHSVVSAR